MRVLVLFSLLLCLLLPACGPKHEARSTSSDTTALQAQFDTYHNLAPRGWEASEADQCDSLLFVALQHVGLGDDAGPLTDAQGVPGHWYRLPALMQDKSVCDSDISRDMIQGLLVWMWEYRQLDLATQLWSYGASHAWKMGEERVTDRVDTRTVMDPQQIGLLADVIHALGGADHSERLIPAVFSTDPGYVSHLTLLHLYLEGELHGNSLTDQQLSALRTIANTEVSNPLAQALLHRYTDGDQTVATNLLLGTWPAARLPTSSDWCDIWRTQRADGDSGLSPCPMQDHTHPGGDFLFAARIILQAVAR